MIDFSFSNKLPIYKQSEMAECGLACIAMISTYFGHKIDLAYLRQHAAVTSKGLTLTDMTSIAESLGMTGRAFQCPIEELDKLQEPTILHWDMNHFVVLVKTTSKGAVIHDPARGKRFVSNKELDDNYTGVILQLSPTEDFAQRNDLSKLSLSVLWSKIRHFKRNIAKIIALSIVVQIVTLLLPYYNKIIVDDVMVSNDEDLLLALAIGFILLTIFEVFSRTLRSWVSLRLSTTLGLQISMNVMKHLLKLPISFFESRHMGDIYNRFNSSQTIRETLTRGASEAIIDGLMSVVLIFVMLYYSWELAAGVLSVSLLYVLFRLVFNNSYRKHTEDSLIASGIEQSYFMETLKGIQTIKLYNHLSSRLSGWSNKFVNLINEEVRIGRLKMSFEMANRLLFGLENIIIIYFAATFVIDGDFTLGAMLAFIAYKRNFTESFTKLVDNLIELKMLKLHVERISDIALADIEDVGDSSEDAGDIVDGDITLENIGFRYHDNSPFLFKGLNLTIKKGESISITGASGQGKTTLLKVIMGLLPPTEGRILFNGRDVREIGLVRYRQSVATIMQDDHLFTGSLKENIALFSEVSDLNKVKMAAFRALLHEEIELMPMGYNTLVGDMGSGLSGGQQQRMMIARALYRDASVLFMDEATSSLDVENEKKIVAYLKEVKKTRISVAHRKETIEMADRKFVLSNMSMHEI